jgi:hypothetical protein
MPVVNNIPGLAYNPYGIGEQAQEAPSAGDLFGAGFRQDNPVVSTLRYFDQPAFEADPSFDIAKAGVDDDLYFDHYETLAAARSQEEYDHIRSRIIEERNDRETLAAGGWGGVAASAAAGLLSPTVVIPAFGPARGLAGMRQAFTLAAAGATADELALVNSQYDRSLEDVALGIAGGTIVGGLLGTAARHMSPIERARAEVGMARPDEQQAILYTYGDGAKLESRTGRAGDELSDLTPEEIQALRLNGGDSSVGAKSTANPVTPFYAPNAVARQLIDKLGKLNPVTRNVNQTVSEVARRATLQMHDAGLRTEGNMAFAPHAEQGTVEARIAEYDAFEATFIQELDDAFARHIEGDKLPEGQLQWASPARVKAALLNPEGKLSHEDFNREVFRVAQTGEEHPDPNVVKAAKAWEKFSAKIGEYANEAYEFRLAQDPNARRLFDPEGNLGPDAQKWVTHVFSPETIAQKYDEFIADLTDNAEANQLSSFRKDFERYKKRRDRMQQLADAMVMDEAQARANYEQNEIRLQEIADDPLYSDWKERDLLLQRQQRAAKKAGDEDLVEQIKEDVKAHRDQRDMPPDLVDLQEELKQIKAEQRVLNQNSGKLAEEAQRLAERIEELEVQDLNALERVTNAGIRLGKKLDRISAKKLDAETKKLFKQLEKALKSVETQKRMMEKVYKGKPLSGQAAFDAYNRMALLSKRRDAADARADEVIAKIEKHESFDAEDAREMLRAVQDLNNVRVRDLNAKRALRQEKLAQKIEDISPEAQKEAYDELNKTLWRMEEDFDTKWRERGAEDLNSENGFADFSAYGREVAEELAERIMGLKNPIAGLEILGGKRGPELARTLNLPLETKSKYLETDMEKLSRIYTRRIAPDIELYRAFGSVNAGPIFEEVKLDFRRFRERLGSTNTRPKSKENYQRFVNNEPLPTNDAGQVVRDNGQPETFIDWPAAEKEKALSDTLALQKQVDTDLRVMVTRLRHQRGVPEDPNSIPYRAGRVAMDVNVARFMGSVVLSSLADVARPVMRYGIAKTLRNGYAPFFSNLSRVKMTRAEANRLGVALDPVMHNRAQAVFDMWEDYASRKSAPERVTGFLANKTGLVAGFDRWTAEMKHITASVTMAEISAALEKLSKGTAKQKDTAFLAELGINESTARRMWEELTSEEGGDLVDGVWLPNTESWKDVTLRRAYAAAVNKATNDIIVTPGLDRPNWVDKNVAAKVIAQFRSFTFTSTNRVVLRGAQEPDMALLQGIITALALGSLSYYTWAMSRGKGDEVVQDLQNGDWGKMADEAIARSGMLGIFAEPWNIAQRIPGVGDKVTFSGEPVTQRRATGLLGQVFGPSVDLAERSANVALGITDPTQGTVHTARGLWAYQNVFYLRGLFDQVEEVINNTLNLPERRGQ